MVPPRHGEIGESILPLPEDTQRAALSEVMHHLITGGSGEFAADSGYAAAQPHGPRRENMERRGRCLECGADAWRSGDEGEYLKTLGPVDSRWWAGEANRTGRIHWL